jgi:hypothetical protein
MTIKSAAATRKFSIQPQWLDFFLLWGAMLCGAAFANSRTIFHTCLSIRDFVAVMDLGKIFFRSNLWF